jgi:PKD domain
VEVGVIADDVVEPLAVETFRLGLGTITAGGRSVVVNDAPPARIADDDVDAPVVTVDAGPALAGTEGSSVPVTGTVTGTATPAVAWSVDQAVCTIADPSALATAVTCADEVSAVLTLTVDGTHTDTTSLTVGNVAPTVAITSPAAGTTVTAGTPVTLALTTADAGATDVLTCSASWGDGAVTPCATAHAYAAAGTYPVVVTIDDGDGATGTASVSVGVTPTTPAMRFDGFYAPVDNAPVVNVVKAGSTVPVKFGLGGDFGLAIFAAGFPASASVPCSGGSLDTLEETAQPGAATLTYDPATGRYHYNWKTSKSWAGQCRTLVLRFTDGNEVTAQFRFK